MKIVAGKAIFMHEQDKQSFHCNSIEVRLAFFKASLKNFCYAACAPDEKQFAVVYRPYAYGLTTLEIDVDCCDRVNEPHMRGVHARYALALDTVS